MIEGLAPRGPGALLWMAGALLVVLAVLLPLATLYLRRYRPRG